MNSEVHSHYPPQPLHPLHSPTNLDLFREKVTAARRQTGHNQKELAEALAIDAQVLSGMPSPPRPRLSNF